MFKLTVLFNGEQLGEHVFDSDSVTVGRSSECELVIDNAGVSRKHCRIIKQGKFRILQDLNSNNGTFVGGQIVTGPHVLNNGEEIGLGKHILRYETDEKMEEDDKGEAANRMLSLDDVSGAMTMQVDAADMIKMQIQRAAKVKGHLSFVKGASRRPVKLEKAYYVIGSWPQADIPASGFGVAPKHALIVREEVNYRLINFGRWKPTRVNGITVEDKVLNNGDEIEVGGIIMKFMAGDPAA